MDIIFRTKVHIFATFLNLEMYNIHAGSPKNGKTFESSGGPKHLCKHNKQVVTMVRLEPFAATWSSCIGRFIKMVTLVYVNV